MPQVSAAHLGDGTPPIALLTAESEKSLESLKRGLRRNPGFGFYVLVVDSRAQAEVERRLRAWRESPGLPRWRVLGEEARYGDLIAALERDESAESTGGLFIPDLDALLEAEGDRVLTTLNIARDRLDEVIGGPLVVVVSPESSPELRRQAPDLYDIRAATYDIEAQSISPLAAPALGQSLFDYLAFPSAAVPSELRATQARLAQMEKGEAAPPRGALAGSWIHLAEGFLAAHELSEARAAAEEAIRLAENRESAPSTKGRYTAVLAAAESVIGEVAGRTGHPAVAESHFRNAVHLARVASDQRALVASLDRLGNFLNVRGDSREAKELLKEAIDTRRRAGLPSGTSHLLLGQVFLGLGRRRDAERHFGEALRRARKKGDEVGAGGALSGLAKVRFQRDSFDDARRTILEAMECYRRAGSDWGMAIAQVYLGQFLLARGLLEQAEEALVSAVDLSRKTGVAANLRMALRNLASVYGSQHRYPEAERVVREALDIDRSSSSPNTAQTLRHLAAILETTGRSEAAAEVLAEAERLGS